MEINIFDLVQLQKLNDFVSLSFKTLQLHLFWCQHQLPTQPPSRSLRRSMNQFMRTWILPFITIFKFLCYFSFQIILNFFIVTERLYLILKFIFNARILKSLGLSNKITFLLFLDQVGRPPTNSSDISRHKEKNSSRQHYTLII